jgi:hypothetical protein
VARDPTLSADASHRRRRANARDYCPGQRVWPLRLPEDHGGTAQGRLAGRQGSGAADLAAGGAESATETEAARTVVVERWVVRAAAAGLPSTVGPTTVRVFAYH